MSNEATGWNVLDRDACVLTHEYEFTKGGLATAFVARLADGSLVLVSPPTNFTKALADELRSFGEVRAIVATNGFHHLGQSAARQHFPKARCFAGEQSVARIKKRSKVELAFEPLRELQALTGDDFFIRDVPNTKAGETWCCARTERGYIWFVSDMLANMPELPGALLPRLLFRWTGSAPGYRVFHLVAKFLLKDKKATLRLLLRDLEEHEPVVIVPAHGEILDGPEVAQQTRAVIESAL